MKFIVTFVALLSFFVLCYTHYDDYSNQTPVEPRLLVTAADLKDFLEVSKSFFFLWLDFLIISLLIYHLFLFLEYR
jgi:hypothetical protein